MGKICETFQIESIFIQLKFVYLPQIPETPCTDEAPTGSSMLNLSKKGILAKVIADPITPTKIDSQALYK